MDRKKAANIGLLAYLGFNQVKEWIVLPYDKGSTVIPPAWLMPAMTIIGFTGLVVAVVYIAIRKNSP